MSEMVGAAALEGVRNMNMESIYEYGSRAGFWRRHRLFTAPGLRGAAHAGVTRGPVRRAPEPVRARRIRRRRAA